MHSSGIEVRSINFSKLIVAIVLSILLSITLFYLTLEIPRILNEILRNYYPDIYWDSELRIRIINALRPYGYLTLVITFVLIILGFIIKRSYLSILGSVAIYLPIFGYFAFSMFFLTGIGVLRILWLPFIELSPVVLELGDIVILPLSILKLIPYSNAVLISISLLFIFLGLLVFSLGVITWIYGKFNGFKVINFWIYKYSRHPQYLGYLLWSYGLLLITPISGGVFAILPTFPWLISSMTIIGIALYEEIEMKKKYGEEYIDYLKKTPFMLPLPKFISRIIKFPLKLLLKNSPRSKRDIVLILITYIIILIILSLIINILNLM